MFKSLILIVSLLQLPMASDIPAFSQDKTVGRTHRVVEITPPHGINGNEVSIAINPTNENNIVAVAMLREYQVEKEKNVAFYPNAGRRRIEFDPTISSSYSNYAFFSMDGGKSWNTSVCPNPHGRTQGDDAIRFNAEGVAIRSYISFLGIFSPRPERAETAIMVSRSADGGASWDDPVPVIEHLNTAEPMEDKPYPVVDMEPRSQFLGNIYVTWTRFDRYGSSDEEDNSQIYFSSSSDQGKSFRPAVRISDLGGDCLDDDNTVEGAVPAVGANGEVYVVWAGPRGMEFDVSLDGGDKWSDDKKIYDFPGGWSSPVDGAGRHNGMPVTSVDHSAGKFRGSLYVNWIDDRNGDLDVFVGVSRDQGKTWSEPLRVNDDEVKNGRPQFFTWMTVDPVDGSLNIVFYDRRDVDGKNSKMYLARSIDGGATFKNFLIDQPVFEMKAEVFMGDYSAIDARNGKVAAAYTFFTGDKRLTAIAAALFQFKPGTQELVLPVD